MFTHGKMIPRPKWFRWHLCVVFILFRIYFGNSPIHSKSEELWNDLGVCNCSLNLQIRFHVAITKITKNIKRDYLEPPALLYNSLRINFSLIKLFWENRSFIREKQLYWQTISYDWGNPFPNYNLSKEI